MYHTLLFGVSREGNTWQLLLVIAVLLILPIAGWIAGNRDDQREWMRDLFSKGDAKKLKADFETFTVKQQMWIRMQICDYFRQRIDPALPLVNVDQMLIAFRTLDGMEVGDLIPSHIRQELARTAIDLHQKTYACALARYVWEWIPEDLARKLFDASDDIDPLWGRVTQDMFLDAVKLYVSKKDGIRLAQVAKRFRGMVTEGHARQCMADASDESKVACLGILGNRDEATEFWRQLKDPALRDRLACIILEMDENAVATS